MAGWNWRVATRACSAICWRTPRTTKLAAHVSAIHTYPVREIYTIIVAGRPTDVGLRRFPAVQVIIAAGAENQRSEAVLNLLFGDFVRGLDQLR